MLRLWSIQRILARRSRLEAAMNPEVLFGAVSNDGFQRLINPSQVLFRAIGGQVVKSWLKVHLVTLIAWQAALTHQHYFGLAHSGQLMGRG